VLNLTWKYSKYSRRMENKIHFSKITRSKLIINTFKNLYIFDYNQETFSDFLIMPIKFNSQIS